MEAVQNIIATIMTAGNKMKHLFFIGSAPSSAFSLVRTLFEIGQV